MVEDMTKERPIRLRDSEMIRIQTDLGEVHIEKLYGIFGEMIVVNLVNNDDLAWNEKSSEPQYGTGKGWNDFNGATRLVRVQNPNSEEEFIS